jgi:hypothetical protein
VALGAHEPQVLEAVVPPVAIDVVELEGDRTALPLVTPARRSQRIAPATPWRREIGPPSR